VERATTVIRENYAEPLTLSDLADAALMSRFHFSRVFRRTTGISPGRFLTAVRLHQAKRLLLTSQHSIADISCLVGYTSLGTFTTRFTECVGVSPGRFRRLADLGLLGPVGAADHPAGRPVGSLTGRVTADSAPGGPVFLGVFDRHLPQGKPYACLSIPSTGEWLMEAVPTGDLYVMAVALGADGPGAGSERSDFEHPMLVAGCGPITVRPNGVSNVDMHLHHPRATDPPVLLTLPTLLNTPSAEPERNIREAV
jgi:AraC family transcriptional regulator